MRRSSKNNYWLPRFYPHHEKAYPKSATLAGIWRSTLRTSELRQKTISIPLLAAISRKEKRLSFLASLISKKKVPGWELFCLPSTGAFSNQFLEGMKQLYELEPFIKVKPYLANQWEKSGKVTKIAS